MMYILFRIIDDDYIENGHIRKTARLFLYEFGFIDLTMYLQAIFHETISTNDENFHFQIAI